MYKELPDAFNSSLEMLTKAAFAVALGAVAVDAFAPMTGMFTTSQRPATASLGSKPALAPKVSLVGRVARKNGLQGLKLSGATEAKITLPASVKPGVVTGQALIDLLDYAKVSMHKCFLVQRVTSWNASRDPEDFLSSNVSGKFWEILRRSSLDVHVALYRKRGLPCLVSTLLAATASTPAWRPPRSMAAPSW